MKLRISMRTILWIVAIVAILVGWMAGRQRLEARRREAVTALDSMRVREMKRELQRILLQIHKQKQEIAKLTGAGPPVKFQIVP
jgi:hypothetical protein